MAAIMQGELLRIDGLRYPALVVSNDFFNKSGKVIVCPVVPRALKGPLHIRLRESNVEGIVLCEQVRFIDLAARHFVRLDEAHYADIADIADAVMGIFEER